MEVKAELEVAPQRGRGKVAFPCLLRRGSRMARWEGSCFVGQSWLWDIFRKACARSSKI